MVKLDDDTIVAIATPTGRGALAVIRVSGRDAQGICRNLLHPWPSRAREATLCTVRDPQDGSVVDHVVATLFTAPRSYTGEHVVELSGHGGLLSPAAVVSLLVRQGARAARPGEFTFRALLNGKLDLLQAESIADLIDARTDAMRRAALHHLDGGLSLRIAALRERVLELEALLSYEIDFPEEDDGPVSRSRIASALSSLQTEIRQLLGTVAIGEAVRTGAIVVIAGRPNVGKSSLFNALLGYRRAIVAELPGTTRDALEAVIEGRRWPLRLVDTAGLRHTDDVVEREGVEVSERYLNAAHLALVCDDGAETLAESVTTVRAMTSAPIVAVQTKVDRERDGARLTPQPAEGTDVVRVSAVTREGLEALLAAADAALDSSLGRIDADMPLLTRARHRAALERALSELSEFQDAWDSSSLPVSIAAVHVRTAAIGLEDLIGGVGAEDILERVFANFCIGK